jgi:DNA replication protein DnaC
MSATTGVTIDTARLPAMLTQLRLPTIARLWQAITETADRESWPAAKTLAALFEHEIAERAQRNRPVSPAYLVGPRSGYRLVQAASR